MAQFFFRSITITILVFVVNFYSYGKEDFFDDLDITIEQENFSSDPKPLSLNGWTQQSFSYGLENPGSLFSRSNTGFSSVQTSIFTQLDWQSTQKLNFRISAKASGDAIYSLQNRNDYNDEEISEFETRFELRDLFFETQIANELYLKIGRQIIAWGQAENLRVTDLVNTQDQTTFGQQDLQDLRLQVPSVLISWSLNNWTLDGVVTFRAGRDDVAPAFDEFDQLVLLRTNATELRRRKPDNQFEYFLRASSHYNSGDFSIVVADVNSNSLSIGSIRALEPQELIFTLEQDRFQAIGTAANWTKGSWLVFAELGLHFNRALSPEASRITEFPQGWLEKNQVLSVLGVEYNGIDDWLFNFEADYTHTHKHEGSLAVKKNDFSFGGRFTWTGFNDRLEILGAWNQLSGNSGSIVRLSIDYDLTDALKFGVLWAGYDAKSGSDLYLFRHNDVVELKLRYNFQY